MNEEELNILIEKYLRGHASGEEKKLLDEFFDHAHNHAGSYDPEKEAVVKAQLRERITKEINLKEKQVTKPAHWPMVAAVVVILLVASGTFWAYRQLTPDKNVVMKHKITSEGQRATLILSDGTVVKLNAGSTLSYPEVFENGVREVSLHGEAFFEVSKNPSKPFTIHTGKVTTTVLGTSFNVRAYPWQSIQVTVATGKVKVEHNPDKHGGHGAMKVILEPKEQVTYDQSTGETEKKTVELLPYIAWKDNILYLQDTPLRELANTLENWYGVEIVLADPQVGNCRLSGKYKSDKLQHILESLQFMQGVSYRFVDKRKIELSGEPCKPHAPMK